MSKNHNDIYNILGKLEALTPKQKIAESAAPGIREYAQVPARGSVNEGVAAIEARLAEKYKNIMAVENVLPFQKVDPRVDNPKIKGTDKRAKTGYFPGNVPQTKKLPQPTTQFDKITKEEALDEKAVSQAQQKFMGMVHAAQKGGKPASPEVAKVAKSMGKKDAKDFASTKHKGLPQHVEEESCMECGMPMEACGCEHEHMHESVCPTCHESPCQCNESMAEAETKQTSTGRVHKGDYGTHYQGDDDEDAKPKKKEKSKVRGRPKKTDAEKSSANLPFSGKNQMGHDPFGRVKAGSEKKTTIKGKKHTIDEAVSGTARRIMEGLNLRQLAEEQSMSLEEMLECLGRDMDAYRTSGHASDLLRDCMEVFAHNKRAIADEGNEVPHNIRRQMPTGQDILPQRGPMGQMAARVGRALTGPTDDELKAQMQQQMQPQQDRSLEEELNELARLAGLDEVSRGQYLKQKDAEAERSGKKNFHAFGQDFGTDEISEEPNEGNAFTKKLELTPKGEKFELDGREYTDTSNLEEADYGDTDVEEVVEPVNKPKKKYFSMKASTMNPGEGDAGEKAQHPDRPTFKNGDNALAKPANESFLSELESIKVKR
jgi:hypothetical protein